MAAQQRDRMAQALDPYIDETVASYVADHGDPTSSVKLDDQTSAFRWVLSGTGAGALVPIAGSLVVVPPRQLVCTVTLTATKPLGLANAEFKDWTITNYRWEGAC